MLFFLFSWVEQYTASFFLLITKQKQTNKLINNKGNKNLLDFSLVLQQSTVNVIKHTICIN